MLYTYTVVFVESNLVQSSGLFGDYEFVESSGVWEKMYGSELFEID